MVWNNLGFFLAEQGKYEEGIRACKKSLEVDPTLDVAWDSLGYAYLMAGEYDAAIAALLKAVELRSDYAAAWRHLLHAYKRSGNENQFRSSRNYALSILPEQVATVDAELITGKIS